MEKGEEPIIHYFPIKEVNDNEARIKNNNLASFPNFHGLFSEDPYTFLFELEVLFRTSDYTMDTQKLNLLPSTIKYSSLRLFIIL